MFEDLNSGMKAIRDSIAHEQGLSSIDQGVLEDRTNKISELTGLKVEGNAHSFLGNALNEAIQLSNGTADDKKKSMEIAYGVESIVRDYRQQLNINTETTWDSEMAPKISQIYDNAGQPEA